MIVSQIKTKISRPEEMNEIKEKRKNELCLLCLVKKKKSIDVSFTILLNIIDCNFLFYLFLYLFIFLCSFFFLVMPANYLFVCLFVRFLVWWNREFIYLPFFLE